VTFKTGLALSLAVGSAVLALFLWMIPREVLWGLVQPVLHRDILQRYAEQYNFDPLFVRALVKVESRSRVSARSHRGAVGLMQLMPETALEMADRTGMKNLSLSQLEDPDVNVHLGVHYLSLLRADFKDDTVALLAAYNAGPNKVRSWRLPSPLNVQEIPFPETHAFVKRVLVTQAWLRRFQRIKNVFS
jgi:soluble lytic murein transglycosylase